MPLNGPQELDPEHPYRCCGGGRHQFGFGEMTAVCVVCKRRYLDIEVLRKAWKKKKKANEIVFTDGGGI